jgi:hypothetical protein
MFYTTPEVKNLEQVHYEPGNSKLQCTSGPALIPATTFLPHPSNTFYSSRYSAGIRRNFWIPAESAGINQNSGIPPESAGIYRNSHDFTI